jgi:hypothetical protein
MTGSLPHRKESIRQVILATRDLMTTSSRNLEEVRRRLLLTQQAVRRAQAAYQASLSVLGVSELGEKPQG